MAVKKKNKPKSSNTDVYYICYKDEIVPTADQCSFIRFNFGAKRWLKNRMLEDDLFMYNEMGIHLHNTPADYKDQEECPWLKQADSLALANAQLEYEQSWTNFYEGRAKMPRFHSKHEAQSYTTNVVSNGEHSNLTYDESTGLLKLPKLKTLIKLKLHRKIKKGGVLKSATISMDRNGRFFVSLICNGPCQDLSGGTRKLLAQADHILPDRRHLEAALNLSSPAFDHSDIRGFGLPLTNRPMVRHGPCSLKT